jgi:hypothetical protein
MKPSRFSLLLAIVLTGALSCFSVPNCSAAPAADANSADAEKRTEEKHSKPILVALNLKDAGKEAKVRDAFAAYFKAQNEWHAQHDEQIRALWNEFNGARSKLDETNASAALGKIDGVYASFKPQHAKFLSELSTVLTPGQVETVEDVLTVNKVKVTYNAYGEIFHGLKDEQKAFILKNLEAARAEAIDAGTMTEKSAFFKKYKIKIEAYLTAQGYDVKESYRVFVAKQKADEAAKKAAAVSADDKKK